MFGLKCLPPKNTPDKTDCILRGWDGYDQKWTYWKFTWHKRPWFLGGNYWTQHNRRGRASPAYLKDMGWEFVSLYEDYNESKCD